MAAGVTPVALAAEWSCSTVIGESLQSWHIKALPGSVSQNVVVLVSAQALVEDMRRSCCPGGSHSRHGFRADWVIADVRADPVVQSQRLRTRDVGDVAFSIRQALDHTVRYSEPASYAPVRLTGA